MKVITDKKIINLDNFDAVEYKVLFGGFSVEATFMGEKEKIKEGICYIQTEEYAKKIVEKISESWINEERFVKINDLIEESEKENE